MPTKPTVISRGSNRATNGDERSSVFCFSIALDLVTGYVAVTLSSFRICFRCVRPRFPRFLRIGIFLSLFVSHLCSSAFFLLFSFSFSFSVVFLSCFVVSSLVSSFSFFFFPVSCFFFLFACFWFLVSVFCFLFSFSLLFPFLLVFFSLFLFICIVLLQIHSVLVNSPYTNVVTVDTELEDGTVSRRTLVDITLNNTPGGTIFRTRFSRNLPCSCCHPRCYAFVIYLGV